MGIRNKYMGTLSAIVMSVSIAAGCGDCGTNPACENNSTAGTVVKLTPENWDKEVIKSKLPTVVEFWAPWCGYCKEFMPEYHSIAKDDVYCKFKFGEFNVDNESEKKPVAIKYNVRGIPTLFVFDKGEVKKHGGRDQVYNMLDDFIDNKMIKKNYD